MEETNEVVTPETSIEETAVTPEIVETPEPVTE